MQLAREFMDAVGRAFEGKRVFVTGHTGFKGSWLCEWLLLLGADVWGYSLPPATTPALFDQLGLAARVHHAIGDVRDAEKLQAAIVGCDPDFVFHLAAQSLVRRSYLQPIETFETNVLGTIHVLRSLAALRKPCATIIVTSDKCYQNHEDGRAYVETDPLGGGDPYSASKAAAEVATAGWRASFHSPEKILAGAAKPIGIATARAGNVIGGGDWAEDRLVPDCFRALGQGRPVTIRNPRSVRPWQHVAEPLSGYLRLAAGIHRALVTGAPELTTLCSAFNFGPCADGHRTVREVVEEIFQHWPGCAVDAGEGSAVKESVRLQLSVQKAHDVLSWQPRWNFQEAVALTVGWQLSESPAPTKTREQLRSYVA